MPSPPPIYYAIPLKILLTHKNVTILQVSLTFAVSQTFVVSQSIFCSLGTHKRIFQFFTVKNTGTKRICYRTTRTHACNVILQLKMVAVFVWYFQLAHHLRPLCRALRFFALKITQVQICHYKLFSGCYFSNLLLRSKTCR